MSFNRFTFYLPLTTGILNSLILTNYNS
ncbi:DUF2905 family protein [Nonlabens xylanidelens]